jgi:copper chaperone CopZ
MEEVQMQTSTFNTPALFGDHHVTEVRRLLFEVPGVKDVYASSGFRAVQITFDEAQTSHEALAKALDAAGYLGEIPMLTEVSVAAEMDSVFRHSAIYETVKKTVSFQQKVPYAGRPLWNCPGMGVIKNMDE